MLCYFRFGGEARGQRQKIRGCCEEDEEEVRNIFVIYMDQEKDVYICMSNFLIQGVKSNILYK